MRKILTLSMVAGAALMVVACGGGNKAANNTAVDNTALDTTYDANADMSMDTNMTLGSNASGGNMSGGNMSGGNASSSNSSSTSSNSSGNSH